jgi:uncharacterized protein
MLFPMKGPDSLTRCLDEKGQVCLSHVHMCRRFYSKFRGLLGTDSISPQQGCWLEGASSVHMFGMRYALDIVFLDRDSRILKIVPHLRPWGVSPWVPASRAVLEIAAGRAAELEWRSGQVLQFEEIR